MTRPALRLVLFFLSFTLLAASPLPANAALPGPETLRKWIGEMKQSPKGPFIAIRWFCKDGTEQPPKSFACRDHGGGIQHGKWSDRTVALRKGGYQIGNVLAPLQGEAYVGPDADLAGLKQILLERFLVGWDDGWIFRGALSYRGALQVEDEQAGALRILEALAEDPAWRDPARFYLLREAVRLLPRQTEAGKAQVVRELAIDVANKDSGFASLRAKIHNAPDGEDAERVRQHVAKRGKPAAKELYAELIQAIDELYAAKAGVEELRALAQRADEAGEASAAQFFRDQADMLDGAADDMERYFEASRMLGEYRTRLIAPTSGKRRLLILEASLAMEDEVYAAGNSLVGTLDQSTRRERLQLLETGALALYGVGLIGERQLRGLESTTDGLQSARKLNVKRYRKDLRYLARAPEWADRWARFNFGEIIDRWMAIEPEANLYPQDRLRGSPMLFYGVVIDSLVNDSNGLAGIQYQIFGKNAGAGVRALNPGLARGVLLAPEGRGHDIQYQRDGIYLLPETISELPPVSGILTRGEGSSLSHVQLLARNLGIPNVVVREAMLPRVEENLGKPVVLAVSPGGAVELADDGPKWDQVFGGNSKKPAGEEAVMIRPDLEKLDLTVQEFVPLDELRARDSGRISGPKGANLGELRFHFRKLVPNGFVVPFGVFRKLLDQPIEKGGDLSTWEWMKARYDLIGRMDDRPEAQERVVAEFLSTLREWVANVDLGADFDTRLDAMLESTFGADGSYGVFVRSDTNVEDLAGFTGAGLNKTIPNVVGSTAIRDALREVWASPFSERAYSWRQSHMEAPEYVFPAVVVQLALAAEKSGVMVTADVDTGNRNWLSVAVNEGVGGAVDGQATESLLVKADGKRVLFLAQATATERVELSPKGGIDRVPTSGSERILQDAEIAQLVSLARRAPKQFPSLREDGDKPADIEFAFKNGELRLLQLRPFVESKAARGNTYLQSMDAKIKGSQKVSLDRVPNGRK